VSFAARGNVVGVTTPACVVNLGRPVELGASLARTREGRAWGTSGGLKAKTNIIPAEGNPFGLGLSGNIGYDLKTGKVEGAAVALPLTVEINKNLKINLNAGWLWERPGDLHFATWGAGVEYKLSEPITLIAEVYGQAGPRVRPRSTTDPRFQAGLRFTPAEKFDIDVIYGRNIGGESDNWITVGLNLRF
jgi:hypothetical protein